MLSALSSLRGRLMGLVAVAVLPALGFIAYSEWEQRRSAHRQTETHALDLAQLAADAQERLIDNTRLLLRTLARLPQISDATRDCSALLGQLLTLNERYLNLGVVNADGSLRCSAAPVPDPIGLAERSFFKRAAQGNLMAFGDYHHNPLRRTGALALAYPRMDKHGRLEQIVFAAIDVAWLSELVAQIHLPPGSTLMVVDDRGVLLARHPEMPDRIGRPIGASPLLSVMRKHHEGVYTARGIDAVERIYGYTRLASATPASPSFVAVGIPVQVAYAAADTALLRNLIVLSIVALLVFVAAWLAADVAVLRQVRGLLGAVRRVSAGDLEARTGVGRGRSELHQLAHAFDDMARNLERNRNELNERQQRITRLNRVYAILSGINSAILRIRERDALFTQACRLAVEVGGFRMAWIGLRDTRDDELRPVHAAGHEDGFLRLIGTPTGTAGSADPFATALARGRILACNNIQSSDLGPDALRAAALDRGYRSCVMLPLHSGEQPIGALHLYAGDTNVFDDEELKLLEELAADISLGLEYINKEQTLHQLAFYDTLTALPNRTLFNDRLDQMLMRDAYHERHAAIVMLRVENFTNINSVHGHHFGDRILKEVADRLQDIVRPGDSVARVGTATFAVALNDIATATDADIIAQKITAALTTAIRLDEREVFVALHVGIAVAPDDGTTAEVLLKNAASALHTPRDELGASIRFYSADIHFQASERLEMERELRHAIERDELRLHYQPIVDLKTLKVIACESLLRWESAALGRVPPARFIPVAEQSGLINQIGDWVLREASRQTRNWRSRAIPALTGINISAHQLRHPGFERKVIEVLGECGLGGLRPAPVTLELTETELMRDPERAAGHLNALRGQGLSVSIDDFGTGYSSLNYLVRLPVDTLKIDISFVRDLTQNANDAAIVRAIIGLAHHLGLKTIAEGVETVEQLAALRELDCDAAQGFLFSPAVAAADFAALCAQSFHHLLETPHRA